MLSYDQTGFEYLNQIVFGIKIFNSEKAFGTNVWKMLDILINNLLVFTYALPEMAYI